MASPYAAIRAQSQAPNAKTGDVIDAAIVTMLVLADATAISNWTPGTTADNAYQRITAHLLSQGLDNQFTDLLRRRWATQLAQ